MCISTMLILLRMFHADLYESRKEAPPEVERRPDAGKIFIFGVFSSSETST